MTIYKAIQKIGTLTEKQLKHFAQLCDTQIEWYKGTIKNYPPDRMEKCGMPYLKGLQEQKAAFVAELERRKAECQS